MERVLEGVGVSGRALTRRPRGRLQPLVDGRASAQVLRAFLPAEALPLASLDRRGRGGSAVRQLAQGHSVCGLLAAAPGRVNGADGRSVTSRPVLGPGPPSVTEGKKLRIRSLSFSGIEELYKTHSQIECPWQISSKCCLGTEDIRWGKADPPRCPVRVCPLPWCSPSVLGRAPAPRLAGSSVGHVTQGLWHWGQLG